MKIFANGKWRFCSFMEFYVIHSKNQGVRWLVIMSFVLASCCLSFLHGEPFSKNTSLNSLEVNHNKILWFDVMNHGT